MSAKFEAFKAALDALCKEHGVRLREDWDYDSFRIVAEEASVETPAGLDMDIEHVIPPTPEEMAAEEARKEAERAKRAAYEAERQAAYFARYGHIIGSGDLAALTAAIEQERQEQRKKNVRVTRIPGDQYDIGDRPCRVFCNEVEILDWTVADDFRRVVETPGGVHHGAVRIDLREVGAEEPAAAPAQPSGFHDVFVWTPDPEPVKDAPVAEPAPAPSFAAPTVKVTPKARPKTPARKRKAGK